LPSVKVGWFNPHNGFIGYRYIEILNGGVTNQNDESNYQVLENIETLAVATKAPDPTGLLIQRNNRFIPRGSTVSP